METSLVEWKQDYVNAVTLARAALGNFLSGMETEEGIDENRQDTTLGNFLSGMETRQGGRRDGGHQPLETSLVEWKPGREIWRDPSRCPWKLP